MGVYIKGMEMPKSCLKCKLFGEYGCPFIGAVGYALTEGRRNEDCPLMPVPPHGRLGDLDALKKVFEKSYEDSWWFEDTVDDAPTIIPPDDK